ncbi:porin [Paracoccus alkenifer]|uniref:Outer membrane protein OmpU n=1 Tax=Paracoccus alkenifer TaxID=65735 RepID=A0A1H6N0T1_9RHOB|nr:porin [Paracoccus alkenifer]SEI08124.1 outer membrane protein OmpU [Paracoccus alkenifer]
MKKALLATTALVLSAGVAAADVTISGYGRTGIIYYEDPIADKETQVVSRLRMNIDASTETDAGVEFGARFRLQWDQGEEDTHANPGKLWISAQGLTVEIGNVDTAMDSSSLIYATELGAFDRSVGFSAMVGDYYAYAAKSYGGEPDRVGVAVAYSFGDLNLRASVVNYDQTIDGTDKEIGLLAEYTWEDRLELSAAYTKNAEGYDGEDLFFVGARYAVMDNARVGLNYVDADDQSYGKTVALYGDYTLADGLTNIEAYVANNDPSTGVTNVTDTAFGIGVNYDLGGARLGASVQRDYDKLVTADMGVRFNF